MSEEVPKEIEERLQRYAKERRGQGGDFSLHGATRRLLHGEVARRHGHSRRRRSSGWAWISLWRGRLGFGGAAVAVLGLTIWLVWNNDQSGQPMQLAQNEMLADRTQNVPGQQAVQISEPVAEGRKQLALASAPRLSDETQDGVSRRESSASLAAPTISLTPAANSSVGPGSSTNLFAYNYNAPAAAGPKNQAQLPAVPAVQLSYFDSTKADQSGQAPSARQAGAEASNNTRFSVAVADAGALGGKALNEKDLQAKEPIASFALADQKRLAESSGPQSRSDVGKAQSENFALGVNRPAAEESLARNRRMNTIQQGVAGGTQSKVAVDALAVADSAITAPVEAKAKAEVALNLPAQAAGELQGGASAARSFYRQALPGQLGEIAQMERETELLKRAETPGATPPVLDRFTVEQQGNWLRIREPDGSVYEGLVSEPAVAASADASGARDKDALVREKTVPLNSAVVNKDGEYSFQASGSNVTLRQMIVVNGRWSAAEGPGAPATDAPAPQQPAPLRRALTPAASGRVGGADIATNRIARMEGTVRVGNANEQRFKAVRTTR